MTLELVMTNREEIYGALLDYYGDIALKQIKNDAGWIVYGARVHSNLNENRYIFVVVQGGIGIPIETTLNQLDWVSFQTRTTSEAYDVPVHNLLLDDSRKKVLTDEIQVVDRNENETQYICNLPCKIRLLHDPRKHNHLQYPDKALLYQALETYHCVIDLL